MKLDEYAQFDATDLARAIREGQVDASEVYAAALAASEAVNPAINAIIETFADAAPTAKDEGPLAGVPFLIKDLGVLRRNTASAMGSRLGRGFVSDHDTHLIERFNRAGLNIFGRTTTPEFGFNISTESVLTGPTRNPWDTGRMAGGSSGGAAAAVAAGIVPIAHGTDAGGSIRIPAACCGLFGFKPTRGRVPNGPDVGDALNGLSTQLAVSRSVRDMALLLDAVEGAGPGDPYVIERPRTPYTEAIKRPPESLKIAVMTDAWSGVPVDDDAKAAVMATAELVGALGHDVATAAPTMDHQAYATAMIQVWACNIAARADGLAAAVGQTPGPDNLEATVWACYRYGKSLSASDLLAALGVFNQVCRRFAAFFEDFDLLLTPTTAGAARPLGTYDANQADMDAQTWFDHIFGFAPFTAVFNVTGQPAMSVPLHESDDGLPIGVQFAARYGREDVLLKLAAALESAKPWADRRPPVHVLNPPA